ncbi:phosphodiester glycosidase family protein [Candidatus Bipolaricaulota bacterium]
MRIHGYFRSGIQPERLDVEILRFPPDCIFRLSVQPNANIDHSIVRGIPIPGTEFCGAYAVDMSGHQRTGRQIYAGTWSINQHVPAIEASGVVRDLRSLGFVGAGNITMNPGFVGFANRTLFYVRGQSFGRKFKCLEFDAEGAAFREMRLDPGTAPSTMGLAGPVLVENGRPARATEIEKMASLGQFYDLRHIIQFPSISWPRDAEDRLHIHVGLNCFWRNGELQPGVVVSALRGEIVAVDLSPYTRSIPQVGQVIGIDIVREELLKQGYRENPELDTVGDFSIQNHDLQIRYYPGIYNHSVIGTDRDGNVVWLGIRGHGSQLGLTMHDTAILAAEHMHDAILVDNGGDVMCRLGERWILPSAYNRKQIRALIFFLTSEDPIRQLRTLPVHLLGQG